MFDLPIILRSLRHRLGFSLLVVLTLGLGVGVNVAMFSVVDAVVLRPLPYPEADRLVALFEIVDGRLDQRRTLSYPDYEAIRDGVDGLASVAVAEGLTLTYSEGHRAERWFAARVSPSYFETLGVRPALGLGLTPASQPRSGPEVVLGHELWQRVFAGDPDIVGRTVLLDREGYTVIGVMPEGFEGVRGTTEVWTSILDRTPEELANRRNRYLDGVGRLADGASLEQVNSQLATVFTRLAEEHGETGYSAVATDLHGDLLGNLRRPALLLLVAVALLLAIASVNVTHMVLVQRQRQLRQAAVRVALGARPFDLLRWMTFETLVLGLLGGGVGLLLAAWALTAFERLNPIRLPAHAAPTVDGRVLVFTLGLSLVLGLLLGLPRAWRGAGGATAMLLRSRPGDRLPVQGRGRRLLLVSEVALALMVTLGATLTALEWQRLLAIDPGFDSAQRAVFRVAVPGEPAEQATLRAQILERLQALPGVRRATLGSDLPLDGRYSATLITAEGVEPQPEATYGGAQRVYRHRVEPNFASTLGIELLRGRFIGAEDHADAPDVAVVSDQLARRLWPGRDPIGQRFYFGPPSATATADPANATATDGTAAEDELWWHTVVGVVETVRYRNLASDPAQGDPDVYFALAQQPETVVSGVVETRGRASALLSLLRSTLDGIHPEMPVFGLTTLGAMQETYSARARFSTASMVLFAGLALLLAAIGIYGVVTQQVDERSREIGIRMALGAPRRKVLAQVVREAMAMVVAGLALGAALSLIAARLLVGGLLETETADPWVLVAGIAVLASVGLVACWLPARRASRFDPLVSLRDE